MHHIRRGSFPVLKKPGVLIILLQISCYTNIQLHGKDKPKEIHCSTGRHTCKHTHNRNRSTKGRSEERRYWTECVRTCTSQWSPYNDKKNYKVRIRYMKRIERL